MDSRGRLEMIGLMVQELEQSGTEYIAAMERKDGLAYYGEALIQSNCKTAIDRKITMIREQLNLLRIELHL